MHLRTLWITPAQTLPSPALVILGWLLPAWTLTNNLVSCNGGCLDSSIDEGRSELRYAR